MCEIRGDYQRYVDGKMVSWIGRDVGAMLVAGMSLLLFETTPLTVLVSTQVDLRDEIRTLVQANMDHNVRFLELEYQP